MTLGQDGYWDNPNSFGQPEAALETERQPLNQEISLSPNVRKASKRRPKSVRDKKRDKIEENRRRNKSSKKRKTQTDLAESEKFAGTNSNSVGLNHAFFEVGSK